MPGFWSNGSDAYADALRAEYEATRLALASQLAHCGSQAEREEIQQKLKAAKAEYKRRQRAMSYGLFGLK